MMPGPRDPREKSSSDSMVRRGPRTEAESDPPTGLVRRDSFRELPPGSVVDDTYEVDARIGAGAMGEVYAARHVKLGKRVAIKVISRHLSEDAAAIDRFTMEARALAQIQHPAIVAVEHVGELADGRAYFVMEFLRGESLFDRLARGKLPLPEALRILDQMARGLDAAHAKGVVHRDVKPENTFLVHLPGEPSLVKIVDFGLSTLRTLDQRAERTQSGVTIGTPMYMSPEQSRGPDVDHRTDIYALGCIAYELVLGRPPFPHARTAPEFWVSHLHNTPPHPRSIWPEVPPQLDLALFTMLAKDPALRPTLAQLRAVIATIATALPARVGGAVTTERIGRRARSGSRWILGAVAACAVTLAGIAAGTRTTTRSIESIAPSAPPAHEVEVEQVAPGADPPRSPPDATSATPPPDENLAPPRRKPPARSTGRSPTKTTPTGAPVDARTIEPLDSPQEPSPPVDRDQTINPFKRKAPP